MFRALLDRQECRPGAIRDFACEPESATDPGRQLLLFRQGSHVWRATQKPMYCRIQFQVSEHPASECRANQGIDDASDPIIPTSIGVALPRLSNDDQEHTLACHGDRKLLTHKRQISVQVAAKKKQSINSSSLGNVLRSARK